VPTFAAYVPVVADGVGAGTRRVYGSYWNRIVDHWGERRLDEPTPSDVARLVEHVRTHVVVRRNARGGRSAAEHTIAALRCIYRHAIDDGLIGEADNPAAKVAKPRRLPSTRRAVPVPVVEASKVLVGNNFAGLRGLSQTGQWSRARRGAAVQGPTNPTNPHPSPHGSGRTCSAPSHTHPGSA
jgi:hypothetical protein